MNIIKQGDPDRAKGVRRFECKKCGCIFEATAKEYQHSSQYNEFYTYCKCPCCNTYVYQEE